MFATALRASITWDVRGIRGIHADVDWVGESPKIQALIDVRLRAGADLQGPTHYQLRVAVPTTERVDEVIRRLEEELRVESTTTKIITCAVRAG